MYIEPKYAWSRQSDIPENLRDVLVNSHGVPAEKILEMRSRMEFIAPVYLGYWARSSRLANSFAAVGIPEKALIEVLQRLTSFHDKNRKIKEGKKNCTYPTGAKVASIRPVTTIDPEQKDQKGASEQQLSDFFSEMVHITTDYDGSYKKILSIRNHEELLRNVLTPCNLQIVALFADERGIGAYVTHSTEGVAQEGKRSKTEAEEMTEIGWIDRHIRQHHNIPKYHLYTQAAFAQGQPKLSLPFMTVRIDPPSKPKDIGIAAEEFYQLLFNGTVSTNQEESETDQFLESKGIFYPNVVNVGKFSAVLFEHPVRFNSTYAYCYSGGVTSMSDYTKKNVGSSPYRPQRSQNRRN